MQRSIAVGFRFGNIVAKSRDRPVLAKTSRDVVGGFLIWQNGPNPANGRLSTATVGRGTMRAVDEVIAATNRLLLIAPAPVLGEMEVVSDLIGGFEPGTTKWRDEWRAARTAFAGASRRAVVG